MTNIDIYSGFLGAGKTTLIKKMIREAYSDEKLVLIENEFGEIGIDGSFMQEAGIAVNEINSGCICCSLVGDFGKALHQVIDEYHPDRILIEPSGVGKLSDVIGAVRRVESDEVKLNASITVVDATKCKVYLKNFGEFYRNQIENADAIIFSRTDKLSEQKLHDALHLITEALGDKDCVLLSTPWDELTGKQIAETAAHHNTLKHELHELMHEAEHHHDEDCNCPHCHEHEHEHHHEHEHEHHHEEGCDCPHCQEHHGHEHHHHHDHHHHHADEIFASWGVETVQRYTAEELAAILAELDNADRFGIVLRAKGIVQAHDGSWLHFDHVPGEHEVRSGCAAPIGRICVIGSKLNEDALKTRFGI